MPAEKNLQSFQGGALEQCGLARGLASRTSTATPCDNSKEARVAVRQREGIAERRGGAIEITNVHGRGAGRDQLAKLDWGSVATNGR